MAAFLFLHLRRNSLYTPPPSPAPSPQRLQQFRECEQIIDVKPGAPGGRLQKAVYVRDTGPGSRHRAELAVLIEIHDAIFAPVQAPRHEDELLAQ